VAILFTLASKPGIKGEFTFHRPGGLQTETGIFFRRDGEKMPYPSEYFAIFKGLLPLIIGGLGKICKWKAYW